MQPGELAAAQQSILYRRMSSFYRSTVQEFLSRTDEQVLAALTVGYANRGYTTQYSDQTLAWQREVHLLRRTLNECVASSEAASYWGLLLEFSIPRKELRIDIVLLVREVVVAIEAKTSSLAPRAKQQIEEYALLLHYFHKASAEHRILPVVVSETLGAEDDATASFKSSLLSTRVGEVVRSSWDSLAGRLLALEDVSTTQVCVDSWDHSPYYPVPTIFEAAIALRSGLSIREIAHSEASEHEIGMVQENIQAVVDRARSERQHAICFLTGVPGSGKTLVGLSLAHCTNNRLDAIHFMSGNGPLVRVLQHLFKNESMRAGAKSAQARTEAKTLIENVHVFARYHTEDNQGPPSNHAVIFDEAQRAWNREQNRKKFKRDYSEPEMILRIMERHEDWAVIVALVGGGQEINDGEAGLSEWGRALTSSTKRWIVHASPEVLSGGPSTANQRLYSNPIQGQVVQTNPALHLRTCNRSLRAEDLALWVNLVLNGDGERAAGLRMADKFPILLSRSLEETRTILQKQGVGTNRFGLIGSSGAARLRVEGLEPSSSFHAEYPWEHWYLAQATDVRSSFRCEVFATEFEVQGLELDWIGLCWGGDFVWDNNRNDWLLRSFRHGRESKWAVIGNAEKRTYRRNAYRVLLTRSRQGMVLFVPEGDPNDPTTSCSEFDATASFLIRCGATACPSAGSRIGASLSR